MHEATLDRAPSSLPGYRRIFAPDRLTLGLFFPIEAFQGDRPAMRDQVALAQGAEAANIAALWVRDVPLRVPSFGDAGQVYDPWVWLGYIAAQTRRIALATGAVVLPLRHVIHVAKAAASIDRLSGGRFVLGVATGDRPDEFPAFGRPFGSRGEMFREAVPVLMRLWSEDAPVLDSPLAVLHGEDVVPKPLACRVPVLITGRSQQTLDWIAASSDGWITYPRPEPAQIATVALWRRTAASVAPGAFKPFAQSLYVDLVAGADAPPTPIHLGYRLGAAALRDLLARLEDAGVHHVILNLKYGSRSARAVLDDLDAHVIGHFPAHPLDDTTTRIPEKETPCHCSSTSTSTSRG
jgi:luciferase-type oxidoreductase